MQKSSFRLAVITVLVLMLSSCKDDSACPCTDPTNPDCENYDSCYGKFEVSADFKMHNILWVNPPDWVEDINDQDRHRRATMQFSVVNFDPKATYKWLLGQEEISTSSFTRDFSNTQQTGENFIPITLIVERTPNLDCFPLDDGRDTLERFIQFTDEPCNYLTNGDFKVQFEGYSDSTIVSVRNWYQPSSGQGKPISDSCDFRQVRLIGFNPQTADTVWDPNDTYQFDSRLIFFPSSRFSGIGRAFDGEMIVDPKSKLVKASYSIHSSAGKFTPVSFSGRKIK